MGDEQLVDRLRDQGLTVSAHHLRAWRRQALLEDFDRTVLRRGDRQPGRPSATYSDQRFARVLAVVRELDELAPPLTTDRPDVIVYLFVRGVPVSAVALLEAVRALSGAGELHIDDLLAARAALFGVHELAVDDTAAAGSVEPRHEDGRAAARALTERIATGGLPPERTGLSHRLWQHEMERGTRPPPWPAKPWLAPVW